MMIFGFLPQNVKTQAVAVAFSIAWAEGAVEPRPGRCGAAALVTDAPAAAGLGRRADPAGGRCEQLAAAGRGHQPGALVLPLLRAGEQQRADDPGVAVLVCGRAGAGSQLVDPAAGRDPARP